LDTPSHMMGRYITTSYFSSVRDELWVS